MEKKLISVVILNWNGSKMLRRFLPSVVENSPEACVIVADNGSTDDSLSMLRSEFPEVGIMAFDRNYGFAEGYNRAIAEVETPYVLLLNDDVEVEPGWLKPMLDFMETHSDVAACQPKVLSEQQRDTFEYAGACGGFVDYLGYPFCRGRMFDVVEKDEGQYDEPIPVFWATGAALFVRTQVYREVGGLDARFFAHQEEIDLCWRLRSRGYGIWCIPQSVVYHVGGGTLSKSNPRKTFLNFRNNLLMLYKNLPHVQPTLFVRFVLDDVAALQMLLTGHVADARAVVRAHHEFRKIKSEFKDARSLNRQLAVTDTIPEIWRKSLLVARYIRGIRRYCDWT